MTCAVLTLGDGAWELAGVTERAFAEVVREHEAALTALARRLCGNAADADDLVHDTYERALRAWERYADRGNLRGWLASILHNLFIDRCRRVKRAPVHEGVDTVDLPAVEQAAPPRWANVTPEQIAVALAGIGNEFRVVYEMHAAGKSYDEIATALRIAKNTVGTRLVRARKKLKEALEKQMEAT